MPKCDFNDKVRHGKSRLLFSKFRFVFFVLILPWLFHLFFVVVVFKKVQSKKS